MQAEPTEQTPTPEPEPIKEPEQETEKQEEEPPKYADPNHQRKRVRIEEKEEHTLKLLLELEAKEQGREYLASDFTAITGRNYTTEARHLKTLWEQGKVNREWKNRQYYYTLASDKNGADTSSSKQVSKTPLADPKTLDT